MNPDRQWKLLRVMMRITTVTTVISYIGVGWMIFLGLVATLYGVWWLNGIFCPFALILYAIARWDPVLINIEVEDVMDQ